MYVQQYFSDVSIQSDAARSRGDQTYIEMIQPSASAGVLGSERICRSDGRQHCTNPLWRREAVKSQRGLSNAFVVLVLLVKLRGAASGIAPYYRDPNLKD